MRGFIKNKQNLSKLPKPNFANLESTRWTGGVDRRTHMGFGYNEIKTRMITVDDRHENLRDSISILDRDFLQRAKIFGDVKPLIGRPKYPFCNKKR